MIICNTKMGENYLKQPAKLEEYVNKKGVLQIRSHLKDTPPGVCGDRVRLRAGLGLPVQQPGAARRTVLQGSSPISWRSLQSLSTGQACVSTRGSLAAWMPQHTLTCYSHVSALMCQTGTVSRPWALLEFGLSQTGMCKEVNASNSVSGPQWSHN